MQLEPMHEKAIDLLVAGKRQNEVAVELNVSTRTLRRWGENEAFIKELHQQHALARKLEQDEAAQLRREQRQLQRLAIEQIRQNITDPKAPMELKKHCLRLGMMAVHFDIAQEWREFVYFDRKKEKAEKAAKDAALRNETLPLAPQTVPIRGPGGQVIANVFPEQAKIFERRMREADEAEAAEKAAKSGHAPSCSPSVPPGVDRKESVASASATQPKPDKSGQPSPKNALIDAICADVVREQSAKR